MEAADTKNSAAPVVCLYIRTQRLKMLLNYPWKTGRRYRPWQAAIAQLADEGVVQSLEDLLSAVTPERLRYSLCAFHPYNGIKEFLT